MYGAEANDEKAWCGRDFCKGQHPEEIYENGRSVLHAKRVTPKMKEDGYKDRICAFSGLEPLPTPPDSANSAQPSATKGASHGSELLQSSLESGSFAHPVAPEVASDILDRPVTAPPSPAKSSAYRPPNAVMSLPIAPKAALSTEKTPARSNHLKEGDQCCRAAFLRQ